MQALVGFALWTLALIVPVFAVLVIAASLMDKSNTIQTFAPFVLYARIDQTLVHLRGTSLTNADWERRRRNSVELLHTSSYALHLKPEKEGSTLGAKQGLPQRDYATHGGSAPIRVRGVGEVGVVTASDTPQREDHAYAIQGLALLRGVSLDEVVLD